jgi:hypothetical protein
MAFDAVDLLAQLLGEPAPSEPVASLPDQPQCLPLPTRPAKRLSDALPTPPRAEWVAAWRKAPEVTPPIQPCGCCRSTIFWRSIYGVYRCPTCHPPAYPALAEVWVRLVATEDGPQVVCLSSPPAGR